MYITGKGERAKEVVTMQREKKGIAAKFGGGGGVLSKINLVKGGDFNKFMYYFTPFEMHFVY